MKHIVFFSGGLGSWATAKRVTEKENVEDVICLFTDTLIEDADLYRFLLETTQEIYGIDQSDLIERTKYIPETSHENMELRKTYLKQLADDTNERNPNFVWLNDGRDPWDVFKDVRFLGNSRLANCSHELKQKMSAKWIKERYKPDECTLYLGIDWTEEHRTKAPIKNWAPYQVEFPMCEEPFVTKIDVAKLADESGIEPCRMYKQDFSHANCGGFCVRGGQGHFINLYKNKPKLYKYHEEKEQEMLEYLDRDDVSILTTSETKRVWVEEKVVKVDEIESDAELLFQMHEEQEEIVIPAHYEDKTIKTPLTLKQLRERYESEPEQIDMFDIGGCGCFSVDEELTLSNQEG